MQLLVDKEDARPLGVADGAKWTGVPAIDTSPLHWFDPTTPEMILTSVDLPAPFSPATA